MKSIYSILILSLFAQCTTEQNESTPKGYWLQEGYGVYLEITDSIYRMYDVTEMSCQPSVSGSINDWTDKLDVLLDLYSIEGISSASMTLKYGITSYEFNRLKKPLGICDSIITISKDPKLNFDVFWHTFKENYAYSELRGVDWDSIYSDHEPLISEKTSEVELFGYIAEILDAIKDEHISLRVPDSISNAYLEIRTPPSVEEDSAKIPNIEEREENVKIQYDNPRLLAMEKVEKLYQKNKFKTYHKDLVKWTEITDNIGYLQINSMNGYSKNVVLNDSLNNSEYWDQHWNSVFSAIENGKTLGQYLRDELEGINTVMETILDDLSNTNGLIIDLRFNPGGTDKVALEVLSHFINKNTNVFTKKIETKNQSPFESEVFVFPSNRQYKGEVIILTSTQTGSSAETFVLASLQLPNFTRVGSNTMGVFSDVLQKSLPNGWKYGLSNEIYEIRDGKNFEYTGIPPDYKIDYSGDWYDFHSSIIELKTQDPAVEKAISLLMN